MCICDIFFYFLAQKYTFFCLAGGYVFNTEAHPLDPAALYCCGTKRNNDLRLLKNFENEINLLDLIELPHNSLDSSSSPETSQATMLNISKISSSSAPHYSNNFLKIYFFTFFGLLISYLNIKLFLVLQDLEEVDKQSNLTGHSPEPENQIVNGTTLQEHKSATGKVCLKSHPVLSYQVFSFSLSV